MARQVTLRYTMAEIGTAERRQRYRCPPVEDGRSAVERYVLQDDEPAPQPPSLGPMDKDQKAGPERAARARLSPDHIRAIVAAIETLPWVRYIKAQMRASGSHRQTDRARQPSASPPAMPRPPATAPSKAIPARLPEANTGADMHPPAERRPPIRREGQDEVAVFKASRPGRGLRLEDTRDDRHRVLRYALAVGCSYESALEKFGGTLPETFAGAELHGARTDA